MADGADVFWSCRMRRHEGEHHALSGLLSARRVLGVVGFVMLAGCMGPVERTIVTGTITPRHIQFVTVTEPPPDEVGGWRVACIHIRLIRSNTGESFLCKFGIETPIRNKDGPISTPLAQRIAAERINEAAYEVLGSARSTSPLGMLCETLKATIRPTFLASIAGARVMGMCDPAAPPVQFGELTL